MAQQTLVAVWHNDGAGNWTPYAIANPSILPSGGTRMEVLPELFNAPTTFDVSAASAATPIVITTTAAHGYTTGDAVVMRGVGGNLGANGTFLVTVLTGTTFSLDGSVPNGAYTSGGSAQKIPKSTSVQSMFSAPENALRNWKAAGN